MIVVCKKYYLDIVLRKISATTTYKGAATDWDKLADEHLKFITANRIVVQPECECLFRYYWLPKLHKKPYGSRFVADSHKCTTKPSSGYLYTSCLNYQPLSTIP